MGQDPDGGADSLDLVAAALRADLADSRVFREALAVRLEGALPGLARVERRRAGLLSRERRVQRIEVTLGDERFAVAGAGHGLEGERVHVVRGIALSREPVPLDAWIEQLAGALAGRAGALAKDQAALQRLLES